MNPRFSIIIPTYNRAYILDRPIASVRAQTITDWELLIVDDGSTDDTENLVKKYNDPRIRYIKQKNAGPSAARNNGMNNAKGDTICYLDSDDALYPDYLESVAACHGNYGTCYIVKPMAEYRQVYGGDGMVSKATYGDFGKTFGQIYEWHKNDPLMKNPDVYLDRVTKYTELQKQVDAGMIAPPRYKYFPELWKKE